MDREITEGFDTAFAEIGLGYDEMASLNKVADAVSNALYELHEIMQENIYMKNIRCRINSAGKVQFLKNMKRNWLII